MPRPTNKQDLIAQAEANFEKLMALVAAKETK